MIFKTEENGFKDIKQNRQTKKTKKQRTGNSQMAEILPHVDIGIFGRLNLVLFLKNFKLNKN